MYVVLNGLVLMKYDNHINRNNGKLKRCDNNTVRGNTKATLDFLSSI